MKAARTVSLYLPLILSILLSSTAAGQEAGDSVLKQGDIKEDLYLAGGTVDVLANVEGDVIVVGGQVTVDNSVTGDVIAAGGNVSIRARVTDDVRAIGGNVSVTGNIGDEAVIAGGQVLLAPTAKIGGRAWLGGNSVTVAGNVAKNLRAAGNRVVISGQIAGDVRLFAESVEIGPNAVIGGNLTYYSRDEAKIAEGARIGGSVTRHRLEPDEERRAEIRAVGGVARLALYISLMVTGIVLYLLFPIASIGAARTINESPWKSLGLGLAVLAATPLVIALLFLTLVGVWLALIAIALYFVLLLLGFLTAILNVGDWGLRLIGRQTASKGWRILSIVVALLALWVVRWIPVLGGLAVFLLLLFGLGALTLYLWRRYSSA